MKSIKYSEVFKVSRYCYKNREKSQNEKMIAISFLLHTSISSVSFILLRIMVNSESEMKNKDVLL